MDDTTLQRLADLERKVIQLSDIAARYRGAMEMQDAMVRALLRCLALEPPAKAYVQAVIDQEMRALRETDKRGLGAGDPGGLGETVIDEALSQLNAYQKAIS